MSWEPADLRDGRCHGVTDGVRRHSQRLLPFSHGRTNMRTHAAHTDTQPSVPNKPFQRFPKPNHPQPPRPDRETAKIAHQAFGNLYSSQPPSVQASRSETPPKQEAASFRAAPHARGCPSPNSPPMQGGAASSGGGSVGRLVSWEQADPPVRCADLPPCVGGLFGRGAFRRDRRASTASAIGSP